MSSYQNTYLSTMSLIYYFYILIAQYNTNILITIITTKIVSINPNTSFYLRLMSMLNTATALINMLLNLSSFKLQSINNIKNPNTHSSNTSSSSLLNSPLLLLLLSPSSSSSSSSLSPSLSFPIIYLIFYNLLIYPTINQYQGLFSFTLSTSSQPLSLLPLPLPILSNLQVY